MTIGFLATGDELVHGDTCNTNTNDMAKVLSSEGFSLGLHVVCSDKKQDIVRCLEFLMEQHDVLIVVGGLGPTTDDATRFALAQFTKEPLVEHQHARAYIEERLTAVGLAVNEGNLQQCLFPKSATLLHNAHGSAMGCVYSWQNKLFILLPGPPRECLPMFHQQVMPLLQKQQHSNKCILKWLIFGLAEGEIAPILEQALALVDCQTGYRWDSPYVEFKVRCALDTAEQVKRIITPIVAPHVISAVDKKASQMLREYVCSSQKPIFIQDDATQGLLNRLLVERGAAYQFIHFGLYEHAWCTIHIEGLESYWSQQGLSGSTQLNISYIIGGHQGSETHTFTNLGTWVPYYAVEWACYKILKWIQQFGS